jgi:crotonobetaine/carnitine-CoA ligase
VWRAFQQRFQIPLREVYGLTEASSFTTTNREGLIGSIGKPLPWIEVSLVDEQGSEVPAGQVGEIVVRTKVAGLLTPGYLDDPEATARLLRGGALYTGDLARSDGHGGFSFVGRTKDAIRCRGELVSAWEVEAALLAHPEIAECAAVAVPAEIGEEEILVFVRASDDARDDPASLARWALENLPRRSCPRYWKVVEDFPRTPSARIAKTELSRDIGSAYDAKTNA